jgi:hypothetical protein
MLYTSDALVELTNLIIQPVFAEAVAQPLPSDLVNAVLKLASLATV